VVIITIFFDLSSFYQKIFDIFLAKALKVFPVSSYFNFRRVPRLVTLLCEFRQAGIQQLSTGQLHFFRAILLFPLPAGDEARNIMVWFSSSRKSATVHRTVAFIFSNYLVFHLSAGDEARNIMV